MGRRCLNRVVSLLAVALCACASVPPPGESGEWSAPAPTTADPVAPAPAAVGAHVAIEPASEADPAVAAAQQVLESTRQSARSTAEWLARSVDGWFGSKPFEDGGKVSQGRLSVSVFKRGDQNTDVNLRFNARFRLPNASQRAYVFVGRDDQRDVVQDTPETLSRQQRLLADRGSERSFLAGLGVSLRDAIDFRLGVGARARPYAQARYAHTWSPGPDTLVDFRQTVFLTSADRFGSTTALSWEHAVAATLAVRWLNAVTITQRSRNFEMSSSLGAYKSLGMQRLLSFEALFNGNGTHGEGTGLSDLGLLAKWEQPIYKTWMFAEMALGHFWPRPDATSSRGSTWALGGSLKMRF